jgi:GR25 family glycosyltransferase involved in LPS biosynthesis|uniref:Glycosyltransferase 2-like domain-containing protein n=1 Tax=viral metagenome TaxID=1070528 RepID=A0A6C0CX56_9ZZZZ
MSNVSMEIIDKQTICLNMIVKNEAHIITKTFDNLFKFIHFDYWVISDTGSTDNTKQIIHDYFKMKNIPGELVEHEWSDFGTNRTLALQSAYNKSDYLFIFDADDSIHGDFKLPSQLTFDKYDIQFGKGFTYVRPLLINNRKQWKWVGLLHEYLTPISNNIKSTSITGDYYLESGKSGARSKDPNKYLKDAEILAKGFEQEKDQGLANRYAFYCAQSYKDAGNINKSIEWYEKVLTLNNWSQEKFYSCYQLGELYKFKNDHTNSLKYFTKSIDYDHERIEGIVNAVEYYYKQSQHSMVNMFYKNYKTYQKNLENKLFLFEDKYNDKLEFFNSISSFYVNDRESGYECCKKILINCLQGPVEINQTFSNLQFYIPQIKNDSNSFELFKSYSHIFNINSRDTSMSSSHITIWNILFQENRKHFTKYVPYNFQNKTNPKIIITFTTCKRFDLFEQTVNSILNTWEDKEKIDYWFCVDDNSSNDDREKMKEKYSFIDYYFKNESEKGHRESMNIIWNKLKSLQPKYWIHMEDDFLFYYPMDYISHAIKGLDTMNHLNVKQILFNKNYGETIENYNIKSHVDFSIKDYVIHDYRPNFSPNIPNCYYWPNFSFRPSLVDVSTILSIGNFDSPNQFFEMDYAHKFTSFGFKSAFFNLLTNRHIGRLTSERHLKNLPNAYDLNDENQFTKEELFPCSLINLDKREDRLNYCREKLKIKFNRYSAVEGNNLPFYKQFLSLLKFIDNKQVVLGEIGCKLSHYDLWKNIQKSTLILEDDIMVHDQTFNQLKLVFENIKNIKVDWDILFIAGQWTPNYDFNSNCYMKSHKLEDSQKGTVFIDIGNSFYERNYMFQQDVFNTPLYRTTAGYIISPNGAKKLCSIIEQSPEYFMKEPLDMWLLNLEKNKQIKMLDSFPHPIYQGGFDLMKEECLLRTDIDRSKKIKFQLNYDNIFDQFIFIPQKDEIGNDLHYKGNQAISSLLLECSNHPKACGVNTLGFFKRDISNLKTSPYFQPKDGIYIKKDFYSKKFLQNEPITRVKLIGNFWDSSKELVDEFKLMIPNKLDIYENIQITDRDSNIDYYVILNMPKDESVYYDPSKTLVFSMEPDVMRENWGKWKQPSSKDFMYVHNKLNPVQWRLKNIPDNFNKTENKLASIMSSKKFFIGHQKRIEFIKVLQKENIIDVFGKENYHKFECYKGKVPNEDPSLILGKYKYYFMCENNKQVDYATEKIWEPIICESLCFYWGCPNLSDYIDSRAYVELDLNDMEKSKEIVKRAIEEDWWSQRIKYIRKERNKILNRFGFFPMLKDLLREKDSFQIYNVWHHKLFDECYKHMSIYDKSKITMYGVNEKYEKIYNKKANYNILMEYDLPIYDKGLQARNYCQTSALIHIYKNQLYKKYDYVGFIQYDMEIQEKFIENMENIIQSKKSDEILLFSLNPKKKTPFHLFLQKHGKEKVLDPVGIIEPYENSILQKYNDYFNTHFTANQVVNCKYDFFIPLLHTFLIPNYLFEKMMDWFDYFFEWLDKNIYNITGMDPASFTERMISLFFCLEMMTNKKIKCIEMEVRHVWPLYHMKVDFDNYKNFDSNLIKTKYESYQKEYINSSLLYQYCKTCESSIYISNNNFSLSSYILAHALVNNTHSINKEIIFLQKEENKENIKQIITFSNNVQELHVSLNLINNYVSNSNIDILFIENLKNQLEQWNHIENLKNQVNKYIIFEMDTTDSFMLISLYQFLEKDFRWIVREKFINKKGFIILQKQQTIKLNNIYGIESWSNIADISIVEKGKNYTHMTLEIMSKRENTKIFILNDLIPDYISFFISLNKPFTILSHSNLDYCMPYFTYPNVNTSMRNKIDELFKKPELKAWYTKNPAIIHDKLKILPLGPKWNWSSRELFGEDREKIMIYYNQLDAEKNFHLFKQNLIYTNFSLHTTDSPFFSPHIQIRNNLHSQIKDRFPMEKNTDFYTYMDSLKNSKFCFSPPGKGIDTHRAYEALLMGCVPIMVSTPIDKVFEDLPVIIEDDWSKIDESYLEQKYKELKERKYNFNKLYLDYWENLFLHN